MNKIAFIYFVILWTDVCFLCEQENASFIYISPIEDRTLAKLSSFFNSPLLNLIFSKRIISPAFKNDISSFVLSVIFSEQK